MNESPDDISCLEYQPQSSEPMYHYCPAPAFWSICRNRAMWLSSIYALNDAKELAWGREVVRAVFDENQSEFSPAFRFSLTQALYEPDSEVLPLVGSFSKEGDLLSQWRAYADDGSGFALEFHAATFAAVTPVRMKEVLYDPERQKSLALNTIRTFHAWWRMSDPIAKLAVFKVLPAFAIDLVSFKHPSFFEERELRAVHLVTLAGPWWNDPGGHTLTGGFVKGQAVERRQRNGFEIPYVSMPINDLRTISGVTLGPKSQLLTTDVARALAELGLDHVRVQRSSSPYR